MKKYRVEISTEALASVAAFLDFIAVERQSPINSERWWRKASTAIESLEYFPHRCPIAPENAFRDYEIRAQIVDPCVFLFCIDEEKSVVRIISCRHGRQQIDVGHLPESGS